MTTGGEQLTTAEVKVPRPGDRPMPAYLAHPAAAKGLPGLIVLHEVWGINENMRGIARRFAREGYVALAVNLFAGGIPGVRCLLRMLVPFLNPLANGGLNDLRAATSWLQAQSSVDPARIGVVGFCLGGGYALALACVERERIRAAAVFYGANPPLEAVRRACPLVVGSYAGLDWPVFSEAGFALAKTLDECQVPHDIYTYPDSRHSFFNERSQNYDPAATEHAWLRTRDFLAEHLRGRGDVGLAAGGGSGAAPALGRVATEPEQS